MTVAKAIFDDAKGSYVSRPFVYTPAPVSPGRQLDRDVEQYVECAARCGLLPSSLSLLFVDAAAEELFLRRAETPDSWEAFRAEVVRRHPNLAARTAAVTAQVKALATGDRRGAARDWRPTTPELCVGAALLTALPVGMTLVADAALPGGRRLTGHVRRSDFVLASQKAQTRVEVAGLVDSFGRPRTIHGARYVAETMVARAEAYAALGLPPPVTLYADQVIDRLRLAAIVTGMLAALA